MSLHRTVVHTIAMEPTTVKTLSPVQLVPAHWTMLLAIMVSHGMGMKFFYLQCLMCSRNVPFGCRTYAPAFDDFFVTSIGDDAQTSTEFWGLLVNWGITLRGGCQQRISVGDEVLWAFDVFNLLDFLKLEGPPTARINRPVILTVTDGATGGSHQRSRCSRKYQ